MGKRKIDPATGKRIKFPSDLKKKKPRSTEQKNRENAARRQKGLDTGEFCPNKSTKVQF